MGESVEFKIKVATGPTYANLYWKLCISQIETSKTETGYLYLDEDDKHKHCEDATSALLPCSC